MIGQVMCHLRKLITAEEIIFMKQKSNSVCQIRTQKSLAWILVIISLLERALALSHAESSHIGYRYPDPRGSIEFPGNSSGNSQASWLEPEPAASVLWLRRNTTLTMVKAKDL